MDIAQTRKPEWAAALLLALLWLSGVCFGNIYIATPDTYLPHLRQLNLKLAPGKKPQRAFDTERFHAYAEWNIDFDGQRHGEQTVGAYGSVLGQPRWMPKLEIKPASVPR